VARLRHSGQGLARLDISVDLMVTSPLVRTRQTAEILASALGVEAAVVDLQSLAPDGSPTRVLTDLEPFAERGRIGIVGHEPGIGELAARLVGARRAIPFKKGAICRIDVDRLAPDSPGELRWFLPPRISRSLRR
jgi:phosphohistidine phosphatase